MDSIFPYINPETVAVADKPATLPVFQEYAYDFENNRLLLKDGQSYLIQGNDALRIWIYKALHTQRFKYVAYSRAYGGEFYTLIGQPIQEDILLPELQRYIVECLMVNPYIRELKNFTFEVQGSKVAVAFDCATVYGELTGIQYQYDEGRAA